MTNDTHDNGREEQWRGVGPTGISDGFDFFTVVGGNDMRSAKYRDAILAARAQAELAQRVQPAHTSSCRLQWLLHPLEFSYVCRCYVRDWLVERDALTAGPTAATLTDCTRCGSGSAVNGLCAECRSGSGG